MAKIRQWFTMKHHGWGWVPITWEGWTVIGLFLLFAIKCATAYENNLLSLNEFIARIVILVAALIAIGYAKGPKPRWRWDK